MRTPDISIVFDMTFSGLTEAYDAELTIDWSEVRKQPGASAPAARSTSSAPTSSWRSTSCGATTRSSCDRAAATRPWRRCWTTVYNKLLELLFKPVEPERVPERQRGGLTRRADTPCSTPNGRAGRPRDDRLRRQRRVSAEGHAVVGHEHAELQSPRDGRAPRFITFNIGDLYRRYGSDPAFFRAVNLERSDVPAARDPGRHRRRAAAASSSATSTA